METRLRIGRKFVLLLGFILILQIASSGITQNNVSSPMFLVSMQEAEGHAEGISLSAATSTPPTIDGIMGESEWNNADNRDFVLQNGDPEIDGYDSVRYIDSTLYIINDHRNLYIALRTNDSTLTEKGAYIYFDDDHDGFRESGEDVLAFWGGIYGPDWSVLPPVKEDQYGMAPDHPDDDGTQDGSAAMASDGVFNYFEFSHPLCSLDIDHDFCLSEGDTVGFSFKYFSKPWGYDFQIYRGSAIEAPSTWGDIIIAPSSGVEDVTIDIQPRSSDNTVDCDSLKGKVKVGILTDGDFDAQTVDVSTLDLEGIEANKINFKDLDHDGDTDALVKFKKSYICELTNSLSTDSISFRLYGQTADGGQFVGTDSIRIE